MSDIAKHKFFDTDIELGKLVNSRMVGFKIKDGVKHAVFSIDDAEVLAKHFGLINDE